MKFYLAARYSRHPEMREYREALQALSPRHKVTSRWIDAHDGKHLVSLTSAELNGDPEYGGEIALKDLEDIDEAHILVAFTEDEMGNSKGGRHVELGYAYAMGKEIIVVGPRENVFYCLPHIKQYDTWKEFLEDERFSL